MSAARHLVWVALLCAAPAAAQQRVERFDLAEESVIAEGKALRPIRDTHALTGLLIGATSGALIGTMLTGFGCLMVEASGFDDCTASGVLLGTWLGGSIGGGIGLLIGLLIPRDDSDARTEEGT